MIAMRSTQRSTQLFEEACRYIPGGVNTSIRVLPTNLVFTRARGSKIYDADGNEYIDYHAAFGPPILGHCHPAVNRRVFETLDQIDLIGTGTTELETQLAKKICEYVPCAEKVLFCNSGSEATYHAIRLSRAVTGRRKIIKFQGCYHGFHDAVAMNVISSPQIVGKGRGPYPHDLLSAGSVKEAVEDTIVLTFNNIHEVADTVRKHKGEIAAIILELIPHNIGCVMPKHEFLAGLRQIATEMDIVLIFDEVITGFRHGLGGYQKICGVTPDLTSLGKAIANGYPCAALCGRVDLMDRFATAGGNVFFAGTFNAHPLGTSAALATIEELEKPETYQHIFRLGDKVRKGLTDITQRRGIQASVAGFGSVFLTYFMQPPIENYTDLLRNDAEKFVAYRLKMLERGIFKLPMNLKRNHISASHTDEDIDRTLQAAAESLKEMK
jgi:glutamate-1-semialdehyde 2,1-aminomutase